MVIPDKIDRLHPARVNIKKRYRLTAPSSTKDTFHVTLDLSNSGIAFNPGDSLGVYAHNDPKLVDHLLNALKLSGNEEIKDPRSEIHLTVKEFFTSKANLSRVTSSFLKLIYDYETDRDKKTHLSHLLQKENKEGLSAYLSSHDPLDLFRTHQPMQVPLQELCAQFGPLLPRFYSVASSLKTHPDQVDLMVAVSTFTHAGEQRFGVASHFLCHLATITETPIPVYVQRAAHFSLPQDPNKPIMMIGPGTGVAPFRAFLQERITEQAKGKNWLFFGERNERTDFFYKEFWYSHVAENHLRLSLAFSRDSDAKIYVQHRMYEEAREFWKWLQEGAIVYICGDAHHMAKDVIAMMEKIAQEQGSLDEDAAKAYIKSLRVEKRLLLDVY